jgi:hypothetical protein
VREDAARPFDAVRKDMNRYVETEPDWKQYSLNS